MSVDIGQIQMKNPVMVASGTFGYGPEYADLVDLNRLGALVTKGICLEPCEGNPTPRTVEVPGGLVNAIGLQGPGVEKIIEEYMPFLRQYEVPVIVNIWGRTVDEYVGVAERVNDVDGVHGLELNVSCSNIKEGGLSFGTDPKMMSAVISAVREKTGLPLIPKLSPDVSDMAMFARVAEESGADAVSLINSVPALVIDTETRRPVLANAIGGLTGPAVHAIAVKLVWEAAQAVTIPVIGMGGITNAAEALEFMIAGASAVAVGTANFTDPTITIKVIDGIEKYLQKHGFSDVKDLVGTLDMG